MTERIKITEEKLTDIAKFLLNYDVNRTREETEIQLQAIKQIQDDNKKAGLFDSLLIENQTILDKISQVKLANEMYEQLNKGLTAACDELREDNLKLQTSNSSMKEDLVLEISSTEKVLQEDIKELNERLQKDHMIIVHANTQIAKLTETKQEQDILLNKQNLALEKLVPETKDLQDKDARNQRMIYAKNIEIDELKKLNDTLAKALAEI